jgi:hypothetical protein
VSSQDGRNAVALNGRRHTIPAELDVLKHDGVEAGVIELCFVSGSIALRDR